jgi:hypothetical protein
MWWIDSKGIHVEAATLQELKQLVEAVEWRLTSTPRTTQEKNDESLQTMMRMVQK